MKCGSLLERRSVAPPADQPDAPPLTRSVCTAAGCKWVFYDNPIPVVAAVVERVRADGSREVLLVRGVGWPASWFGLVTGFLEARESPAIGVLREVKEELGLDTELVDFLGVFTFPRMNQLILAYHVRVVEPEKQTIQLQREELEAFKAVPLSQLRPWAEGTGLAVREFLRRQTGRVPPDSDTAFSRKNIRIDPETGAIVETIPAKL